MNFKQLVLVALFPLITIIFLWWVPSTIYGAVPQGVRDYFETADSPQPLILITLGVPAALCLLTMVGFFFWLLVGRTFASRSDVEGVLSNGLFGPLNGPWISRLLTMIW